MVWGLPPGRAGRAPQASRQSNRAEVALGAGWRDGGLVVGLESVADVAAGFEVEVCLGPVSDADPESILVLLEQAPTADAKPTLPASRSN